jgi:hypothetical protein
MSSGAEINANILTQGEERQTAVLKNIQQLQDMEKQLYTNLDTYSANGTNLDKQTATISKINELSQMRISMFEELDEMYKSLQGRAAQTRVDLVDQMVVTGVIEKELNNAKKYLNALNSDKNNKMRMVEINTYYSQKYRAQSSLMKAVIIISLVLLVLGVIAKKGLVPQSIMSGIIGIWILISAIYIIIQIFDLSRRSNMNFDEYNWAWNPNDTNPTVIQYDKEQLNLATTSLQEDANNFTSSLGIGCVGENCCADGTTYNKDKQKCVEAFGGMQKAVSYVEDPISPCPWKLKNTTVTPFNKCQDSYVRF